MQQNKLLLLAVVGLGAYLLMSRNASAAQGAVYRQPGTTATGAPRYPTAQNVAAQSEAAAYASIGSMLGGVYNKIAGNSGGSAIKAGTGGTRGPVTVPEDGLAANPFGIVDPYSFEAGAWGVDLGNISFYGG